MATLSDITTAHGFAVLEHLEHDADVPVVDGLQAQGDLFVVPVPHRELSKRHRQPVPPAGIPVIEAVGGGHEHRLFARTPGTAWWRPIDRIGQDIGYLQTTQPTYILHPEHGAAGIAPGTYLLRRQREQADEERLIAD